MHFINAPGAVALALCAAALAAAAPASAKPGGVGWQTPTTICIPAGTTDYFAHGPCPTGYSAVSGGAFAVTNTTVENGFTLTGQGPRLDLMPAQYNEWVWNFEWAGGAANGSQIVLNVYCKKGAP